MSKLPSDSEKTGGHDASPQPGAAYLIMSMMDTTWRMFVPTIGLLLVGNALDEYFGTKPWLLLAGAVLGGAIAAILIKLQLAKGK